MEGQNRVKSFNFVTVSPCSALCGRRRQYRRAGRRRARPRVGDRAPAILVARVPSLSSRAPWNLPVPSRSSPSSSVHAEIEQSSQPLALPALARHPARTLRVLSCATSPRPSSTSPRPRPCPNPAEIELPPPPVIAVFPGPPPSPSSPHLRSISAQIEPLVSSTALSSPFLTRSPAESHATVSAVPPRRRGRAERRPRAPPGLPAPARGPLPRAPRPLGLPGPRAAPPRDRPAPPPAERRRRRAPPPYPVCAAALFPHARPALCPARAPASRSALAAGAPRLRRQPAPAGPSLHRARMRGQKQGRALWAGPAPTAMWGPVVSPPPLLSY